MELNHIKDAFNYVMKKQKLSSSKSQEIIKQIGREIEQALLSAQLVSDTPSATDHKLLLIDLKNKLTDIAQLEGTHRELNVALSKYTKLLERTFIPDISKAYRSTGSDIRTVNQIIASHFYREGQFELGDCFVNEVGEPEVAAKKSPFLEMYEIVEAMRRHNLEPALRWAANNHKQLKQNGSDIELKLHSLQFVEMLQKRRGRGEALRYARTFLAPFAENHMGEIQKLVACLLWAGRLDSSPTSELLSQVQWDKVVQEFTHHFCNLKGYSYRSPLSVTIGAGIQCLPTLLKLMNVMIGGKKQQEWERMKQLPVAADLDREFQFHSIFVCPVSKEQDSESEDNPPMLLSCGYVLCKQSFTRLSKNNSTRPFKCPYCPSEVVLGQCRQLYF